MQRNLIRTPFALGAAFVVCLAPQSAQAQGLIQTAANYIIRYGDPVPDGSGTPIAGVTFSTSTVEVPVVDDNGFVSCQARLEGTGINSQNLMAHFYGSSAGNLKMVVQGHDNAPGLPGVIFGTASTTGLNSSMRLTPDGRTFFSGTLSGTGVVFANDTALFGGPQGALALYVREGDVAPGTSGAIYSTSFTGLGLTGAALNSNNRMVFKSLMTGGDVSLSTNNEAYFEGTPGSLVIAARKGVTEIGGAAIGSFSGNPQMNAAGQFIHGVVLSTTLGTTPATAATNFVTVIYTPGSGNSIIVREGDVAPGTVGATFVNPTNDAWAPGFSPTSFTRSGKTAFVATVSNGDTTVGVNDQGLFVWDGSTLSMAMRRGSPAPGTDAMFGTISQNTIQILDDGRVGFVAALTGGTSTTADDSGLWFGQPGSLALVAREGATAPGSGGGTFGAIGGTFLAANDLGQIVFTTQLFPSTNPGIYAWSAGQGLIPIVLNSEVVDIGGGTMRTIASFSTSFVGNNNSDGAASGFNHAGDLVLRVNFAAPNSTERALVKIRIPNGTPSTSFCSGDGSGTACPCANSGAAGHGCASSSFAGGARLASSGVAGASVGTDTLVLTANDIPGPGLFFQGDGQAAGGAGIPFGDGLLCLGGNILRLGVVFPTGSSASYPGGLTPNPIHIGGLTASGDVRNYQCWYRDSVLFCTSETYNLTQGLTLTWSP